MLPRTPDSQALIHNVRDVDSPAGTLVGGVAADYTDSQDGISRTLPWALGWVMLSVLVLIFIFTGSIILPIKAVLLNFLSLGATMGALTWVFIDGNLQWLVGSFTVTGTLDTSIVILIAVVVFGLSMDYELFLLSRIREEHLSGKTNVEVCGCWSTKISSHHHSGSTYYLPLFSHHLLLAESHQLNPWDLVLHLL